MYWKNMFGIDRNVNQLYRGEMRNWTSRGKFFEHFETFYPKFIYFPNSANKILKKYIRLLWKIDDFQRRGGVGGK